MTERVDRLVHANGLKPDTKRFLEQGERLSEHLADHMVENCVGTFELPLGLGMNLRVDGVDRLVPMVIEEPSVVAGLSKAARIVREGGDVTAEVRGGQMIGQIQVLDVPDIAAATERLLAERESLLREANSTDPVLVGVGGGARDLEVRVLDPQEHDDPVGPMLVVHLLVDVQDAMGANVVNTMAEHLAPRVAELTGGRVLLRILSNLADHRLVSVDAWIAAGALAGRDAPDEGSAVARSIQEASVFAERDPYRAATHNKGVMNGIDAVLVAFGQDWRAVEAGAHAYAARSGRYQALARWRYDEAADELRGHMTLPMAVGTVGGVVQDHPAVRASLDIARCSGARDLAALAAATGLVQNLAALLALATDGIQRGHMRLHLRKMALSVGATGAEVEFLVKALRRRGRCTDEVARQELAGLRQGLY